MRQRDQFEVERANRKTSRYGDFGNTRTAGESFILQLAAQQCSRKRCRVKGTLQAAPQIGHGADMVFVRVRQHEAGQTVTPASNKERVWHDNVDPRRRVVAEGDAAIDHQPLAGMAIQVEVHANFARST